MRATSEYRIYKKFGEEVEFYEPVFRCLPPHIRSLVLLNSVLKEKHIGFILRVPLDRKDEIHLDIKIFCSINNFLGIEIKYNNKQN
jgi:hypothetical protein